MADDIFERLARCTGFERDEGNAPKIRARQGVTQGECEQIFVGEPLWIVPDARHSVSETRRAAWGRTFEGRELAIVFSLWVDRIRPISARDMSRKERQRYAEAATEDQADP